MLQHKNGGMTVGVTCALQQQVGGMIVGVMYGARWYVERLAAVWQRDDALTETSSDVIHCCDRQGGLQGELWG